MKYYLLSFIVFLGFSALAAPTLVWAEDATEVLGDFFSESSETSSYIGEYETSNELEPPRQGKQISDYRQRSRFEEVRAERAKRPNRDPRAKLERTGIDTALDYNMHRQTGNGIKHGLDALQNIAEAVKIRQNRVVPQSGTANHLDKY